MSKLYIAWHRVSRNWSPDSYAREVSIFGLGRDTPRGIVVPQDCFARPAFEGDPKPLVPLALQ